MKFGIQLTLKNKITSLALLAAILPMLMIFLLGISLRSHASSLIHAALTEKITEDLTHVMQDFYSLCETANDFSQQFVNHGLKVAHDLLSRRGSLELAPESVHWQAMNQFTEEISTLSLPKMMIGNEWLGRNHSFVSETVIVDEVHHLIGATCTIFQRMNEAGDMLRIATNVRTREDTRAIGTFIPAVNPDGSPNDVVRTILSGQTFRGRAFVVNDWYLTAYEPIRDADGSIIGALYVGVLQESAQSFRKSILRTKVGKTGYLFSLIGSGSERGQYVISEDGKQDGQLIRDVLTTTQRQSYDEMLAHAVRIPSGEIHSLTIDNAGQTPSPGGSTILLYSYFEPWDWVIGALAYEEDYRDIRDNIDQVITGQLKKILLFGSVILILIVFLALVLAGRIARPVNDMARASRVLAESRLHTPIHYGGKDEIGVLTASYNSMAMEIKNKQERLEAMNEELSVANATKDKFFSIIAHDLKNPFNNLLTYSETLLMQMDQLDRDKMKWGLEKIRNNSQRGYNLLMDLLNWARSQLGKMEINPVMVDLQEVAGENVALVEERGIEKDISISSTIRPDSMVYADRQMVSTVIRNLVTNAVKFTAGGGQVQIHCRPSPSDMQVTVEDTGMGISEENIQKLFRLDTFYKSRGTDDETGTGLGLILCREFIEKLGGHIWVESVEGEGSRFCFTLPRSNPGA